MGGQPGRIQRVARDLHPAEAAELRAERVQQARRAGRRAGRATARAVSGAGTNARRRSLGSDLISSVTSSSRRPGTCQLSSSALTWLSAASGMSTVTPSSGSPGANSYDSGSPSQRARVVGGPDLAGGRAVRGQRRRTSADRGTRRVPSSTRSRNAARTSRPWVSAGRRSRTAPRRRRRGRAAWPGPPAPRPRRAAAGCAWKNAWWVCQSPSTRALVMNRSRAAAGSTRA